MDAFAVASLVSGALTFLIGALIIFARARVLTFVRNRFEKAYRDDHLSEAEIIRRSPKMSAVMIIGLGFVTFGMAQIVFAALSTMLRAAGT